MKSGDKQRLPHLSTKPATKPATQPATQSLAGRPAFSDPAFKATSANTTSAANAFFAPVITAGKSVNLSSASPGATLNYTVTIGNSGSTATTGVLFSDTIDANTTLVPGSVNTSPLALNDAYTSIGNVAIAVPAVNGVLANDFDPDGTIPAIVAVNTAGTQGTVSLNMANGSFTFNPNPGFEGTTMFTYTLSDGALMDTGVVSVTVSGMIWFVDDSVAGPGDGRLSAPFNSIANFNSLAADDPGDNIFLFSGNYTGPLTLLNNQKLIGQGATASIATIASINLAGFPFSNALPATGGTRPAIANAGTNLTLGQGNIIRGFDVTNTGGTGILGNNFGSLTASEISVTSSSCSAAVSLTNGNPTASFTTISASSCTNGISLSSTTGSFTVTGTGAADSGGVIQNSTGSGILATNAQNLSLTRMRISNPGNHGIEATNLGGTCLLSNSTIIDFALATGNGFKILNTS
ncbi:MAG: Ig-like domain-containing protein, partial [Acidobacteriota bacterium]